MPKEIKRKKELIANIQSNLLSIVRESDGISRLVLSKKLKLAPSTVGIYVERLLEEGFLLEAKKKKALRSGRPEVHLMINPDRGHFIGVDFYAERIMAMSVDFANDYLKQEIIDVDESDSEESLKIKILNCIEAVDSNTSELLGIGVSIPGSLEKETGKLIKYKWLPNLENFEIGSIIKSQYEVPLSFENTANLMALGEMKFGEGKNLENFVNVTIRSGIGCGVVINGEIVKGEDNLCGEIEYWKCPGSSINKTLPELGELTSSRGIIKRIQNSVDSKNSGVKMDELNIADVISLFIQNNPEVVKVVDHSISVLSWALGQMSLLIAPQKFVLSGDFTTLGDKWLVPIQQGLSNYYNNLPMSPPKVILSTLGENSAALGAASIAVQNWRLHR